MKTIVLFDIDSRIPNLALMKLSTFYKDSGWRVILARRPEYIKADLYLGSAVFRTRSTLDKIAELRKIYANDVDVGGSAVDLKRRLPVDVEACFPDYSLYGHDRYAIGFLTRGCPKTCKFCVVPAKEGRLKVQAASFSGFVPPGWKNVLLLDDNLLVYSDALALLEEIAARGYSVNFSQTLDIGYLSEPLYQALLKIDSQNARFTRKQIYFSLNYPGTIRQFEKRASMLKGFGKDRVSVVSIYGFDTRLSEDYSRWMLLRRLALAPFFQEYWPIEGIPSRLPNAFFDMDLNEVIRLTFRSNGINWEKYLRWLNRLYFKTYGRYYQPLVEKIYRYNNKERVRRYLDRPETLTGELYRSYLSEEKSQALQQTLPGG
ncbi:MAG: hypothetical protein EXR29_06995 [Betaproteobacteria bacterium]|nr:hypothetical protein [Betaproteobacteria bacterium]